MATVRLLEMLWAVFVCLSAVSARGGGRTTTITPKTNTLTTTAARSTTTTGTRNPSSSSSLSRSTPSIRSSRSATTTSTTFTTRQTTSSSVTTWSTSSASTSHSSRKSTSQRSGRSSDPLPSSTSMRHSATPISTTSDACSTSAPSGTVCPSAWTIIVADLAPLFRDSGGTCTDMARAAVRYAFHDAAGYSNLTVPYNPASGGADGSLLLSVSEITRTENNGLGAFHANLTSKYDQYKSGCATRVGAADLVQVAGWLGVQACPGGEIGRVYVGRNDTRQAAPDGLLPIAFGPGSDHDTIYQLFQEKGFTAEELAALIGAHSSSRAFFQTQHGIPAGTPQDSTPGKWDANYYTEIYNPPPGIGRFDSDINLSNLSSPVGRFFETMQSSGAWRSRYSPAHEKMSLLGLDPDVRVTMQDCTTLIRTAFSR